MAHTGRWHLTHTIFVLMFEAEGHKGHLLRFSLFLEVPWSSNTVQMREVEACGRNRFRSEEAQDGDVQPTEEGAVPDELQPDEFAGAADEQGVDRVPFNRMGKVFAK